MLFFLETTRTARMALFVSVFVFIAVGSFPTDVHASCGDYLVHSRVSSREDLADPSLPVPVCQGGSCRSAPSTPPVEPSRIVFSHRQPLDFQLSDSCFDPMKMRRLEIFDDALPSSATLEVTTPPPILNA